jgi:hypothetical protein
LRYYFIGYLIFLLIIALGLLLPLSFQVLYTEESRLAFREDAKVSEFIKDKPLVFAVNVIFLVICCVYKMLQN